MILTKGQIAALRVAHEGTNNQTVMALLDTVEHMQHIIAEDWTCDCCGKWFSTATGAVGVDCDLCPDCVAGIENDANLTTVRQK